MLMRYIVIAVYGLGNVFNREPIFLVYDNDKNSLCGYFELELEAFDLCDELNNRNIQHKNNNKLRCHILIEANASYNNNDVVIHSPYIESHNALIIAKMLKICIEKELIGNHNNKNIPNQDFDAE
ncbi:TPA: hypothetical protein PXP63_004157 [Yersinia enterocolitica]|nr:hypothetical protein [Yersinia enterocolitica]